MSLQTAILCRLCLILLNHKIKIIIYLIGTNFKCC